MAGNNGQHYQVLDRSEPPKSDIYSLLLTLGLPVLLAVLYGSGFLAVFSAEEHLGLHESDSDYFRLKFFHVGALILAFVTVAAGSTFFYLRLLGGGENKARNKERVTGFQILFVVILAIGLFIRLSLAPAFTFERKQGISLLLLNLVVISVVFRRHASWRRSVLFNARYARRAIKHLERSYLKQSKRLRENLRENDNTYRVWVILAGIGISPEGVIRIVVLLPALLYTYWEFNSVDFAKWDYPGRWFMGVLLLASTASMIGASLFRMVTAKSRSRIHLRTRMLLGTVWVLGLYYLIVWSFGVIVYPYMPIEKGGADYSSSLFADIELKADGDAKVFTLFNPLVDYVILLQTDNFLMVAKADDHIKTWGKPFVVIPDSISDERARQQFRRRAARPETILEIPKSEVRLVSYHHERRQNSSH